MIKEISRVVEYLLSNHNKDYPDKYLKIELSDETDIIGSNIRIDATGPWIKNFCAKTFVKEFWLQKKIFIHIGENTNDLKQFKIYKICDDRYFFELEEPYIKDCEYYVSFVFNISKQILKSKFPVLKKYIRIVAEKYKDIRIQIVANNEYWEEDEKIGKCINLICEGLTTIMVHDSTNACRDLMEHHFGVSTKDDVSEKLRNVLSNKILNYSQHDLTF